MRFTSWSTIRLNWWTEDEETKVEFPPLLDAAGVHNA